MRRGILALFLVLSFALQSFAAEVQGNPAGKTQEKTVKLDDVVVSATKTEMKTQEVPAAVNVVTDDDIKLTPGADNYYDAIRNVPGVAVNKGGFFDTVLMRGKEPSILINGRDMNPFITNTSMITGSMNVGMGAVERIEVIKGPQAAIHGSKAVSGAVNVIHKREIGRAHV